ncbi:MAG: DUF4935 domain-containing protein [Thermoplasmatales archaeon]|nr:DUF4935 domain-containing protein [Thermoplasmatales archaeon]
MKIIVLDTNIIYQDFWFRSPQIRTLIHNYLALNLKFYIPEIVFDETISCFKKALIEKIREFKVCRNKLANCVNTEIKIIEFDIDTIVLSYKKFLKTKFSGFHQIVTYPENPHKELSHRAISRIKPFTELTKRKKVAGYRDTLIWMTILEIAKSNHDEVVFITNNTSDFYENSELHNDLKNDLKQIGKSESFVTIYQTVDEFFNREIKNDLQKIEELEKKFKSNNIEGLDHDFILEKINEYYTYNMVSYSLPYSNSDEVSISYLEPEIGEFDSVWKIDENEYAFHFYVDAMIDFEYFINNYEILGKDLDDIEIQDRNWNDHVMQVSKSESVSISVSISYELENKEVIDLECDLS